MNGNPRPHLGTHICDRHSSCRADPSTIIPDSEDEGDDGEEAAEMMSCTQQEAVAIYAGPGGLWGAGDGASPPAGAQLQPSDWNEVVFKVRASSSTTVSPHCFACLDLAMSVEAPIDASRGGGHGRQHGVLPSR